MVWVGNAGGDAMSLAVAMGTESAMDSASGAKGLVLRARCDAVAPCGVRFGLLCGWLRCDAIGWMGVLVCPFGTGPLRSMVWRPRIRGRSGPAGLYFP